MNHEEKERERLRRSFLDTFYLMEGMGVPREVLFEAIESALAELRGAKHSPPPAPARAHIEVQVGEIDRSDPLVAENVRRARETADRLDVILKDAAAKYDIFVSISACITELAIILRAVKEHSGGDAAVRIALDGLEKCVSSGEPTISPPIIVHPKH